MRSEAPRQAKRRVQQKSDEISGLEPLECPMELAKHLNLPEILSLARTIYR